jgi:hypothetical protein
MVSKQEAKRFATEWIEAWNSHDIEAILSHYDDEVDYYSPMIERITGDSSGRLQGKPAVRAYITEGLRRSPTLEFRLLHTFTGVESITLHYLNADDRRAAEVFELSAAGKVSRVLCHYDELR